MVINLQLLHELRLDANTDVVIAVNANITRLVLAHGFFFTLGHRCVLVIDDYDGSAEAVCAAIVSKSCPCLSGCILTRSEFRNQEINMKTPRCVYRPQTAFTLSTVKCTAASQVKRISVCVRSLQANNVLRPHRLQMREGSNETASLGNTLRKRWVSKFSIFSVQREAARLSVDHTAFLFSVGNRILVNH